MRVVAKDLPGLNSLDFDRRNGKLYASQVFLGDALWEIDVAGQKPPRLIKKDMGGFNGFEVGPDGMLYGPLWFKGQVVKIDPSNGAMTVIADGFKIPAAANLDGKGNLWVVDARSGELVRVELASGRKTVARQLKPSLDNLAIAPDGTIYVSNMADNSIEAFDPATGELRAAHRRQAGGAGGPQDRRQRSLGRRHLRLPPGRRHERRGARHLPHAARPGTRVPVRGRRLGHALRARRRGSPARCSWSTARRSRPRAMIHGLKAPVDAIPMADGSVLYAEIATGSVTRASGPKFDDRRCWPAASAARCR